MIFEAAIKFLTRMVGDERGPSIGMLEEHVATFLAHEFETEAIKDLSEVSRTHQWQLGHQTSTSTCCRATKRCTSGRPLTSMCSAMASFTRASSSSWDRA